MKKIILIVLIMVFTCRAQEATGRSEKFKYNPPGSKKEQNIPLPEPKKEQILVPQLKAGITVIDPSGNNMIDAEEKVLLSIALKNNGGKTARECKPVVKTQENNPNLMISYATSIGDIRPGDSLTFLVSIEGKKQILSGIANFNIRILEKDGFDLDPEIMLQLRTREYQPPKIQFVGHEVIDDNLNGKVEKNEKCTLKVRLRNIGENAARKVMFKFSPGENVISFDEIKDIELGDLHYGESKDVQFPFTTNNRVKEQIVVNISVNDISGQYGFTKEITIPMDKFQKGFEEVIIAGKEKDKPLNPEEDLPSLGLELNKDIPKTDVKKDNAYAVIIGNKSYQKVTDVDFAENDAKVMRNYLIDRLGYDQQNVIYVGDATISDLRYYFGNENTHEGWLFNNIPPNTGAEVFVYYSGHGAPDPNSKQGYIIPVDCDPNAVKLNGYSLKTFFDNLNQTAIDKQLKSITVVVDACFSGNSEKGLILKDISPIEITVTTNSLTYQNSSVFSSSKSDQVSNWYTEKHHGLFTYFFLKGLRGEADGNLDGRISTQELFDYVSSEKSGIPFWSRKLKGRLQNPTFSGKSLILVGEE